MSASSKKKIRKEQQTAALTERQLKEQKEAKKLKAYTISFIAIMLVVVLTTVSVMSVTAFNRSGFMEKRTIAATVGDHQISSVELSYYFRDMVNSTYSDWYNSYGNSTSTYLQMMGLDVSKPLDEQKYGEGTWADYFMDEALTKAKSDYVLADLAAKDGFTLSEEEQESLKTGMENMELYATAYYGFKNLEDYLQNNYTYGADVDSYSAYSERTTLASAYYAAHKDSLKYTDADLRGYEKDKFDHYSSYTYYSYYVNNSDYLTGGTKDDKGNTTYSDAEKEAARAKAEEVAKKLAECTNLEELNKAIAALDVNKDKKDAASTKNENVLYTDITEKLTEWVTDADRKENDVTYIKNDVTTTDKDEKETTVINGYYVVLFESSTDNICPMGNVRHLLVKFETDKDNKVSDEAKKKAKEEADGYLKTWKEGKATEESFIELVKKNSDDSSASTGGLFEDINPSSSYVTSFRDWAIDENRKAGDAEVIETEYGYHVMYYVGASELNYRDYMINNDMVAEAMEKWYEEILKPVTLTENDLSRVKTDIVLSATM